MPAPGDVDIVIAAELMEAGRAIMRGLVTPDRTTLIASAHRAYAVSEKMAPGDGIADASKVLDIAKQASHRLVAFDMESIASRNGSMISASLFGALAGSGALPFTRAQFEEHDQGWRQRHGGKPQGIFRCLRCSVQSACGRTRATDSARAGNDRPARPARRV